MSESCESCPQREVHDAEFRLLDSKVMDVKERVGRIETMLARGILMLVANMVGVLTTLVQQFMGS